MAPAFDNGRAVSLPLVRRLEAVGFRAWPAASVRYDGSWQVRLTEGYASKRLNCVVPLDPSDSKNVADRMAKAARSFSVHGRSPLVRETPLMPPMLLAYLDGSGWERFESVVVMTCDISALELPETMDHLPIHDAGRFVDAYLAVSGEAASARSGLASVIGAIEPTTGLFVIEDPERGPVATALCVQDNDLAGILSLCVGEGWRRQGRGTEILSTALRWARVRGARTAWLQVEAENAAALALYARLGFREAYRYHYWREAKA